MLQVLCGIVGTKRFKFDVWSNDVTLANEMESTGRPGQVHVSEATFKFLPEETYVTTEGPEHKGKYQHPHGIGRVPNVGKDTVNNYELKAMQIYL